MIMHFTLDIDILYLNQILSPQLSRSPVTGQHNHSSVAGLASDEDARECDHLAEEILEEYFSGVSWIDMSGNYINFGVIDLTQVGSLSHEATSAFHSAKSAKRICRVRARVLAIYNSLKFCPLF